MKTNFLTELYFFSFCDIKQIFKSSGKIRANLAVLSKNLTINKNQNVICKIIAENKNNP
jgi:hypothetical protein